MKTIESNSIGILKQNKSFDDWWESKPVHIPFLGNKKMSITFMDFIPDSDLTFIEEADQAIISFLSKNTKDRLKISDLVYKNCMDFLNMVAYDEADKPLWDIKDKNDIWKFIYPQDIYITRGHAEDKGIYLNITCECEWEQEHGLQMIFKRGSQLVKISEQDGYIAEEKDTTSTHQPSNSLNYKEIEKQNSTSFWATFKKLWK